MTKHEEICGLPQDMDEDVYFCVCNIIRMERKRLVSMLEEEAERNACSCGDICTAYDNGFEDAIFTIKDSSEYPIVE